MKKRLFHILAILAILVYSVPSAVVCAAIIPVTAGGIEAAVTVVFPDPNLEAAIRQAIGKPSGDIFPSDLSTITSFSAPNEGIANLSGLEYCSNLTSLDLNQNQISNLAPLSSLTNLTLLYLVQNQISDITPLVSLTNLTELDLYQNQISDIEPLVNNIGLTVGDSVDLRSNPLSASSISIYIPQLQARGVTVLYDRKEGDVNRDNVVNSVDALKIAQHLVGVITLTGDDLLAADVDNSGAVTSVDLLMVKQYLVGVIGSFPERKEVAIRVRQWEGDPMRKIILLFVTDRDGMPVAGAQVDWAFDSLKGLIDKVLTAGGWVIVAGQPRMISTETFLANPSDPLGAKIIAEYGKPELGPTSGELFNNTILNESKFYPEFRHGVTGIVIYRSQPDGVGIRISLHGKEGITAKDIYLDFAYPSPNYP